MGLMTVTSDREQFLDDPRAFVGFKTLVCRNADELRRAGECLDAASLDACYRLCHETARMSVE